VIVADKNYVFVMERNLVMLLILLVLARFSFWFSLPYHLSSFS